MIKQICLIKQQKKALVKQMCLIKQPKKLGKPDIFDEKTENM